MVLARVKNVKSGWKSMFMVFTTAATDDDLMIVRLAFETIEKIVREHFEHITETEVRLQTLASQGACTDGAIIPPHAKADRAAFALHVEQQWAGACLILKQA